MAHDFTESTVEDAALSWVKELGYCILHGPEIAPEEPKAERTSFAEVILGERFRASLCRLNPKVSGEILEEAFRKITVPQSPALIVNNRAFHKMLIDGI